MKVPVVLLVLVAGAFAGEPSIYFKDQFDDGASWEDRWIHSTAKGAEAGKFKLTAGKFYGDAEKDKGIQTSTDARFYHASAKFDEFSNEGKSLVVQFSVKHEQSIDCGGGYIKLFPSSVNQKKLNGDSDYYVMFGPDICGPATKKVHVIFNYKGKNLLVKKDIRCKDDEFSHLYTLVLNSDNTYEVLIDNERADGGKLEEDWDFLAPKQINDPEASKPSDWDDRKKIDDPEDTKPEDFDKPQHIPDPDAEKPEDWDDDVDGEWEPPMIDNPEYKGEWKPRQIDNPAYKGSWVHPQIDNPDYSADDSLYRYTDVGAVGFDLWQVKAGTIFDNILVTDDVDYAAQVGTDTWGATKEPEKAAKAKIDEEEAKTKAAEEEAKKGEEETTEADAEGEEEEETEEAEEDQEEESPRDEL
eukprot:scpid74073/ scgid15904/ Calreticulin; CRP55; Calregulin; Endoplasmic reticulum resident protein 60; HACBP; grp60